MRKPGKVGRNPYLQVSVSQELHALCQAMGLDWVRNALGQAALNAGVKTPEYMAMQAALGITSVPTPAPTPKPNASPQRGRRRQG